MVWVSCGSCVTLPFFTFAHILFPFLVHKLIVLILTMTGKHKPINCSRKYPYLLQGFCCCCCWNPLPLWKFYFPFKMLASVTLHPLRISSNHPWGGYACFLEPHISNSKACVFFPSPSPHPHPNTHPHPPRAQV